MLDPSPPNPQHEQLAARFQTSDEVPNQLDVVGRREPLARKYFAHLPEVLIGEADVRDDLRRHPPPDCAADVLAPVRSHLGQDLLLGGSQVDEVGDLGLDCVLRAGHLLRSQPTVVKLNMEAPEVVEGKPDESLCGGSTIDAVLQKESHLGRHPAGKRAAKDPDAEPAHHRADEVATRSPVELHDGHDGLGPLRGGDELEPR